MKTRHSVFAAACAAVICMACSISAPAQNIGDLLKGLGNSGGSSSTVSNILSGIFSNTKFTIADIAGEYVTDGPAVTFKSDNFLEKAGGIAGAAAIESKLAPYYKQYGLNGMTLSIAEDGSFVMTIKKIPVKGIITEGESEGNFLFKFTPFGKTGIGNLNAYIEKSGSSLDVMFDATKLKNIISTVANLTGGTLAKTAASLLDNYEGACMGFRMTRTGDTSATEKQNSASEGINALKDILTKKKQ